MDPLTHTAMGLFLSRAGLNRWTPCAAGILMLAANAPDIDIVTAAGGSINYLHYHRHLTHSLIAMPVMALLPVVLVRLAARKPIHWVGAYCAALIAVASHLALDWTNVYGIRLALPFSGRWFRGDLTGVVDFWIWGVCLLGVAGPFLSRLVGSEIASGGVRDKRHGLGFAVFALLAVLVYDGGRAVLHARAAAQLEARLYRESAPLRVAALPSAVNPLVWRGLVETGEFYALAGVNLADEFDPARAAIFHKPEPEPAIEAARRAPLIAEFLRFAQFPLWRVTPADQPENARLVEVFDLRFGTPREPAFVASALVDSRLQVTKTSFEFGRVRPR
jgi:inner membrane protein